MLRFSSDLFFVVLLMFCIELFIVLIDDFIVVMIGAARVVVTDTFVRGALING